MVDVVGRVGECHLVALFVTETLCKRVIDDSLASALFGLCIKVSAFAVDTNNADLESIAAGLGIESLDISRLAAFGRFLLLNIC